MDTLDLLRELGHVEPADQAVLDAARDKLAEAIGCNPRYVAPRSRKHRRPRLVAAAVASVAVSAAAGLALVLTTGYPAGKSHPAAPRAAQARASHPAAAGSPSVAAVLTAFAASRDDILEVSKTVRGEGSCCRYVMWFSQAAPAAGTLVRSRIVTFNLDGSRRADMALSYTVPASAMKGKGNSCAAVFSRPQAVPAPAAGMPATLTRVDYAGRFWLTARIRILPASISGAAELRACLQDGQWRVMGRSVLGGIKVIEMATTDGAERLWVSAATFLPVRLVSITPTPYGSTDISFGFRFLPPTAFNRAVFAPLMIPAGFSRQAMPG